MLISTTACSIAILEHRKRTLGNQYLNGAALEALEQAMTDTEGFALLD
jgi:hypothetical protein